MYGILFVYIQLNKIQFNVQIFKSLIPCAQFMCLLSTNLTLNPLLIFSTARPWLFTKQRVPFSSTFGTIDFASGIRVSKNLLESIGEQYTEIIFQQSCSREVHAEIDMRVIWLSSGVIWTPHDHILLPYCVLHNILYFRIDNISKVVMIVIMEVLCPTSKLKVGCCERPVKS